ncbi:peptidase family M41-domain-containing protein [Chytriomyces sp. MP71]|nr:peptidase family M41-domain-containing protein [Chytriomyces sp. MP71]
MGSSILYAILLLTGLSVILDQQGVMKSGMGSIDVEPNTTLQNITFDDVQGVDEAKQELEEVVQFLKEPGRFTEVGGKLPKGILLYGPPGTGKTYLARAIAGEAGVPFFQMSGSEFDELYVGVGAKRVRELFAAAKKKAPCIVFIDEIDAVGSKRSSKDQSYMRQTLNQLLVELDGFATNEGVIFIAATNTPESLDKALVRPGRFDRHIPVSLPDVRGRTKILQRHSQSISLSPTVNLNTIARGTPGFSGADLANLINHAAIQASKLSHKAVTMEDLEWAKDRIVMGAERKSAVVTEQAKKLTAYHEGGHALVALYTKGAATLHKVTVIPRGSALGLTVQLPEGDKTGYTKRELEAMMDVSMGGRAAEEMIFGEREVTTGASSDLENATRIAREMIMVYGMNEKVGLASYARDAPESLGAATKELIEGEVRKVLDESYVRAKALLVKHQEELHRLAVALVEHETLDGNEVKIVLKGELTF